MSGAFQAVLHDWSHLYEDLNAALFSLSQRDPRSPYQEFLDCLADDPIARKPLTKDDFGPKRAWKKGILSIEALKRQEERLEERMFLRRERERAKAHPEKFLAILQGEKANGYHHRGEPVRTWIFVERNGRRLGLGTFLWIAGSPEPYQSFTVQR
jgi:hypothetical protein